MTQPILTEEIKATWKPVLEAESLPKIDSKYKAYVTTVLLENQRKSLAESNGNIAPVNQTVSQGGNIATWDPVLISMVRRSVPNLLAFDVAGVQPMNAPTGQVFALRTRYEDANSPLSIGEGDEALYLEANPEYSGNAAGTAIDNSGFSAANIAAIVADADPSSPSTANLGGTADTTYTTGKGMSTADLEALGDTIAWKKMGFTIDKLVVAAEGRGLRADYTHELAQDLKAVHGLDAEAELANILTTEIQAEMNREMIRRINFCARFGGPDNRSVQAPSSGNAAKAYVDLSASGTIGSQGRWFIERFKALLVQIEFEANKIAKDTRRGKANFIITSSNVASALSMAGILDHAPAMSTNLNVDDTGNLFAGTLMGKYKVYIDPYANLDYVTVGYRGATAYDAGIYYCPYVPLEMYRAQGQDTFQPRIGFKTRYGIVANPFATGKLNPHASVRSSTQGLTADSNIYFRKFIVANLMG